MKWTIQPMPERWSERVRSGFLLFPKTLRQGIAADGDDEPEASTHPTPSPAPQGGGEAAAAVCDGCPHLTTEYWRDYLDNDETDSGTKATCAAENRCIDVYWNKRKASPEWCPLRPTPPAQQPGEVGEAWIAVSDRLPDEGVMALVCWTEDGEERYDFDAIEEGAWIRHSENYEHFLSVALPENSRGPSEEAPYTYWRVIESPPAAALAPKEKGNG